MQAELYVLEFLNGKAYVGITTRGSKRFRDHLSSARNGSTSLVHRAIRKHGEPKRIAVLVGDERLIRQLEIELIQEFRTQAPNGYNLDPGGAAISNAGRVFTDEHRMKISQCRSGRPLSGAHKDAISSALRGQKRGPLSEQHRQSLRDAHLGIELSADHRAAQSRGRTGKKLSESHRKAISEGRKRMFRERRDHGSD